MQTFGSGGGGGNDDDGEESFAFGAAGGRPSIGAASELIDGLFEDPGTKAPLPFRARAVSTARRFDPF